MSTKRHLVVSIHDVAPPQWPQVQQILKQLTAIGIHKRSLLVIPNYQGRYPINEYRKFAESVKLLEEQGDEIVLHGYEHVGVGKPRDVRDRIKDRWYTEGEGEFLNLGYAEARHRLELGMGILAKVAMQSSGFVAPAWLINRDGLKAAADLGFQYTNSYLNVLDLANQKSHIAPSLVFGPGNLNEDLGIALQRVLAKFLKASPIVRVVIHPPCVDHRARFKAILSLTEARLVSHEPATYLQLLHFLRKGEAK